MHGLVPCYATRLLPRAPLSHLTHFALHQISLAAKEAQAIAPAQFAWNAACRYAKYLTTNVPMARLLSRALLSHLTRFTLHSPRE
ncbi:MAG: hypothetical protein A3F13_00405 [Gammaproteobacteria bacterium RIFCSPHIGHO2_12_FULL_40_19]|nr:MAG: hypothetical protein A3F13_00405 [Gammaproteobacteria bacterium RIFCSPHIGHO2_12_FULL_40_19]